MNVADFIPAALREQGASHCRLNPGGLNDNLTPVLSEIEYLRPNVAALAGDAAPPSAREIDDVPSI